MVLYRRMYFVVKSMLVVTIHIIGIIVRSISLALRLTFIGFARKKVYFFSIGPMIADSLMLCFVIITV